MYQSHTGRLTGLWFLPKPAFGLNTNDDDISYGGIKDDQLSVAIMLWNCVQVETGSKFKGAIACVRLSSIFSPFREVP